MDEAQQADTDQLTGEFGETFSEARTAITTYLHKSGAASISVAVAKGGEILWEEAFGWANREERIEATPHTMYSLASITKSITATGVMVLADRGLIDIEQPVDEYLGPVKLTPYAGKAQEATVKRVLGHRAGLPDHWHFFYENEAARRPHMDETVRKYGVIVYPPGEAMCYSNIGFGILDYVLARVSGKGYAAFLKSDVFLPLGMTHSSVGIGPDLERYVARRYDGNQHPVPFYDFDHWGGSSVFSSAHDLVRFGMFFLKDHLADQVQIMSDEAIDVMHQEHEHSPGPMRYGLGWILKDVRGFRTIKHTGGMPGVRTWLMLIPSEHVAAVALTNSEVDMAPVLDTVVATVVPAWREPWEGKKAENHPLPSSVIGEWTGEVRTYERALPVRMVFQEDGDIHVKLAEQMETLLNTVVFREGGMLKGDFWGQIETRDTQHYPHTKIRVEMLLRGDELTGYAQAQSARYGLSSWIHLTKQVN